MKIFPFHNKISHELFPFIQTSYNDNGLCHKNIKGNVDFCISK